jgi:hypothetical protein
LIATVAVMNRSCAFERTPRENLKVDCGVYRPVDAGVAIDLQFDAQSMQECGRTDDNDRDWLAPCGGK